MSRGVWINMSQVRKSAFAHAATLTTWTNVIWNHVPTVERQWRSCIHALLPLRWSIIHVMDHRPTDCQLRYSLGSSTRCCTQFLRRSHRTDSHTLIRHTRTVQHAGVTAAWVYDTWRVSGNQSEPHSDHGSVETPSEQSTSDQIRADRFTSIR